MREWLRGLEVFAGPLADFDPAGAPAEPVDLFLGWLGEAVAVGVPDAHAMTLSTIGEDGGSDARVLILKNVDGDGWQFAVHAHSPKGRLHNRLRYERPDRHGPWERHPLWP
ncbi:FMN-binding pyridoxamine 5'-phosphate oxidase-related protein [Streptomyces violaceusniger Tu 4113]|uniref:FMN-binding pyridoxamine 5'-phosphate oxidase-related protein n=1 Tax=Streptomyces violaceusniger (strain Tu 4113) TaxID=653045 RepID=G2NU41_STRV4|nr:FMN-binding pyridoxamine 5'-phosphate oxidase-related protein [Streptomyces violaceusniger Tu 4113]